MKNVTVEDVRKHYIKTHHTTNMRFVIAGKLTDVRIGRLLETLENYSLAKGTKRFELPNEAPTGLKEPLNITNRSVENIHFYFDTFLKRRLPDDQADALGLVNTMLTETLHSRILGEARERGLVYGMSSNYLQTKQACNWWFGSQVTPENAPALFTIIAKELQEIREGKITHEDIASAQQYLLGRYQRSGQTVFGVGNYYSGRYFFDDVIEDFYDVPNRIKAVNKEAIVNVVNEFFDGGKWGLGFLGSAPKALRENLHSILEPLWAKK